MIAKVTRGDDTGGLVRYLLGAGRANEHTDQRVIATSVGVEVDLSTTLDDGQRRSLVDQLETPRAIYGGSPSKGHVYHLSLSNPAADRTTSAPSTEHGRKSNVSKRRTSRHG